jgi:hypothetical protein
VSKTAIYEVDLKMEEIEINKASNLVRSALKGGIDDCTVAASLVAAFDTNSQELYFAEASDEAHKNSTRQVWAARYDEGCYERFQ